MKFSIISSILSVASIAAAADAAAASPSQACVPYDGVCFQNGMNYGACCGDGICAGSRCRDPKTEAGGMATTSAANNQGGGGAVVTQIGDGQIQVPTSVPVLPTPTPTIPIVNGAGKAMPGLAAAGVALAFLL